MRNRLDDESHCTHHGGCAGWFIRFKCHWTHAAVVAVTSLICYLFSLHCITGDVFAYSLAVLSTTAITITDNKMKRQTVWKKQYIFNNECKCAKNMCPSHTRHRNFILISVRHTLVLGAVDKRSKSWDLSELKRVCVKILFTNTCDMYMILNLHFFLFIRLGPTPYAAVEDLSVYNIYHSCISFNIVFP